MIQQINVLLSQIATQPRHTRRNTHSSGSTCYILLSPDNIAAVKVAASVIGCTNHSRIDEMVPSRRSESQGGPSKRTSCQSIAMEEKALIFCTFIQCHFHSLTCCVWPSNEYLSVRTAINVCSVILMMLTCRLHSAFICFYFLIIFYASLGVESPLTSISHGSSWVVIFFLKLWCHYKCNTPSNNFG